MVAGALENVQRQRMTVDLQRITTGAQPTDAYFTQQQEDGSVVVRSYAEEMKNIDAREKEIVKTYSTDLAMVEAIVKERAA
jgi:hypothetical protein